VNNIFQGIFALERTAAVTASEAALQSINDLFGTIFEGTTDPVGRADNQPALNEPVFWNATPQTFISSVLTDVLNPDYDPTDPSEGPELLLEFDSPALALASELDANSAVSEVVTVGGTDYRVLGYVAHGPAVYSDVFNTTRPMNLNLEWRAIEQTDFYSVLGYVVNTATCQQIEVIDATGGDSGDWQTVNVAIPEAGNYRFVFVSGTYDYTWGAAAGANFYIDNIRVVPINTQAQLTPDFVVGSPADAAPFTVSGRDLRASSAWSVDLGPGAVRLGQGVTDANGAFEQSLTLPRGLTPGSYTITLNTTAPDGSARTSVAYITVDAQGQIAYLSLVEPAQLAATGTGLDLPVSALAAALLIGAGLATRLIWPAVARRRSLA
jgi:hypothetical protein